MKERLLDWLASYLKAIGRRDYIPSDELQQTAMLKTDARLGNIISLRFRSKETRDDEVR